MELPHPRPPAALERISELARGLSHTMESTTYTGELLRSLATTKPGGRFLELGTSCGHGTAWILDGMDSEAELAGVLAHEIAHSVLSHSYKRLGESALTGTAANLISSMIGREVGAAARIGDALLNSRFSRDKEKQSDILGLRVLDAAGYSADGLYNVMAKLKQLKGESNAAQTLLSSHPASEERMRYLEELIQTKGYNRYGYEGVEAYRAMFPR